MKRSLTLLLFASSIAHAAPAYQASGEIAIGGDGGWDYLSVDASGRRLYLAQATRVVVVDIDKNTVLGEVANTPGVHGFAVASDLGRGFSSNGKESTVSIVDLTSLKTIMKVPTGENPDAIVYEPATHEVYAFNGKGKSATVIDGKSGKVLATIPLGGKPEFAAVDSEADRVYVNIEDKNTVVAIDTRSHKISATWPIAPGEEASGLAIDTAHHRLFLGCHNEVMVMMDSQSGKVLASAPIGKGVDSNWFDPETGTAYSSNGVGNVTVAHEDSPASLTVVQVLQTEPGARTMALDPKSHRVYLATAKFDDSAPGVNGKSGHGRKVVPGTLKLLVYSR